jgi:hypothetical protein
MNYFSHIRQQTLNLLILAAAYTVGYFAMTYYQGHAPEQIMPSCQFLIVFIASYIFLGAFLRMWLKKN